MNELLFELLKENFPSEYETVGPTNVDDIIKGNVDFIPSEFGSNMDLSSAIGILVAAVTFIKSVLEIYKLIKKDLRRSPKKEDIEVRIIIKNEIYQVIDGKMLDHLLNEIIYKIEK